MHERPLHGRLCTHDGARLGALLHQLMSRALADAMLAGPWTPDEMAIRLGYAVEESCAWQHDVAHAVWIEYPEPPRDRPRELARFVGALLRVFEVDARVIHWTPAVVSMAQRPWPVPVLNTVADVADVLGLTIPHLQWLADRRSLEPDVPDERLRHYRYRWIPKVRGARLLEAPKPILKHAQRVIGREILAHVPAHAAAHGFVRGRSVRTSTAPHVGRRLVVHMDLEQFFASIDAGRIYGLFRRCGYAEPVAHILTALVTNAAPYPGYAHPHLPQGSPTSPALANLVAFRLDRRLSGLAASMGARYTRYADDLAFSLESPRNRGEEGRLIDVVARIVRDERFRVRAEKTTVRGQGQRQILTGVVVNAHPNVTRREYDLLKAAVHNAARDGAPASERDRLMGRISWVRHLNPERGDRLLAKAAAISWH